MENRTRIAEGAAELFRKYGIKTVTMDMLASHLGISKRTIYENFSDKNDLLTGVTEVMSARHKELVVKLLDESDNAVGAVFKLIEISIRHFLAMSPAFIEDMKRQKDEAAPGTGKCHYPDHRDNRLIIERGISEKLFRKDINADIVARTIHLMLLSVMNTDFYPVESYTRKDVLMNTVANYLKGISTPEGLEFIRKHEKTLLI